MSQCACYASDNPVPVQDQVYNQPHEGKFSHEALAVSLLSIYIYLLCRLQRAVRLLYVLASIAIPGRLHCDPHVLQQRRAPNDAA